MAIDNISVIDFIGTIEENNEVVLTISDQLDWKLKTDHLLKLQAKINSYLDFVESGEIYEEYSKSISRNIVIEVVGKYDLPNDNDVNVFCDRVKEFLKGSNISLRFFKL